MSIKKLRDVMPPDPSGKEAIPMKALIKIGSDEIFLLYVSQDNFECCHFEESTARRTVYPAKINFPECRRR